MRHLTLSVCLSASVAFAQVVNVGDIVVVPDPNGSITQFVTSDFPTSIFPSSQEQFCRAAYNAMRASAHPDIYDGVITFSTSSAITDLNNVWQGAPVRADATGIGRDTNILQQQDQAKYNSTRVGQCVYMGALGKTSPLGNVPMPNDPDGIWRPSIGIPIPFDSETGIEMMGHEYGHHWLMGVTYDLNDGKGKRHLQRGTSSNGNSEGGSTDMMGTPNQHYSALADSRSVMYGSCITPNANGSYHQGGCVRKYNHIDQYLMGLRAPEEVSPMLVLENPSDPGNGVDSIAMSTNSSGLDVSGTPYMVTAESIVRAMGPRSPAYPAAKHCWRVAFIVVLAPGETSIAPAMYAKVERYRERWSEWFRFATDGRGTMDTRITGEDTCLDGYLADGGVDVPDAGPVIGGDAGVEVEADGGEIIAPDGDAGTPTGSGGHDAGTIECATCDLGKIRPGCGCGSASGLELVALLGLGLVLRSRRAS